MVPTMVGISVQPCSFQTLGATYRLHCTAFPSPYSFWRLVYYQIRFRRYFLIACWQEEVLGYVMGGLSYVWRKGWVGEIVSIATDPKWRRQGIAERLLTQALEEFAQSHLSAVYLQVSVTNEPAQKLYRKLGFQEENLLLRYYSTGEDAYLLRKSLTG